MPLLPVRRGAPVRCAGKRVTVDVALPRRKERGAGLAQVLSHGTSRTVSELRRGRRKHRLFLKQPVESRDEAIQTRANRIDRTVQGFTRLVFVGRLMLVRTRRLHFVDVLLCLGSGAVSYKRAKRSVNGQDGTRQIDGGALDLCEVTSEQLLIILLEGQKK